MTFYPMNMVLPETYRAQKIFYTQEKIRLQRKIKLIKDELISLTVWMGRWSLKVNSNKSLVMLINNYDNSYHHTTCGVVLLKVMDCEDLEVSISSDLKTTSNCKATATKVLLVM